MTQRVPPGWYPDPFGRPGWSYFDGFAWTPHFAPRDATPAVRDEPNPALHLVLCVVSCGSWIPVWIVITIVTEIRRNSSARRPRGVAGSYPYLVVIGGGGVALSTIFAFAHVWPYLVAIAAAAGIAAAVVIAVSERTTQKAMADRADLRLQGFERGDSQSVADSSRDQAVTESAVTSAGDGERRRLLVVGVVGATAFLLAVAFGLAVHF